MLRASLTSTRPNTTAMVGLLMTKNEMLEDAGQVEARVREASLYLPLHNLALSTQCGFSSSGLGNPLSTGEQRARLWG